MTCSADPNSILLISNSMLMDDSHSASIRGVVVCAGPEVPSCRGGARRPQQKQSQGQFAHNQQCLAPNKPFTPYTATPVSFVWLRL
jgi:hypothetical protein